MGGCAAKEFGFTAHAIVSSAVAETGGEITCYANGIPPYTIECFLDDQPVEFEDMTAKHLAPGQYTIHITDAQGRSYSMLVDVESSKHPTVVKYIVEPASSDLARDGTIRAVVENMPDCEFLWTTGVVTQRPILYDVAPGMYSITPLCNDVVLHACPPATLGVVTL